MAASIVQETFASSGSTTADTYTVTLSSDTAADNQLFIVVSSRATVATPSGFTLDKSQVNNNAHYVFRKTSVAETSSWTIDPGGSNQTAWWVAEISGLDTSPFDVAASTGSSSGVTSRSTGTTATTAQADEWLLASSGGLAAANPPPTMDSWTNSFTIQGTAASSVTSGDNTRIGVALRDVTATGDYETTVTYSSSLSSTAIIATYKVAAVAAVYPPFPRRQLTTVRM